MAYENIQRLLNGPGNGLTTAQQSENYRVFGELMKENIYLPDLLAKIKNAEDRTDRTNIDAELFAVMESAVKDDASVIEAKRRLQAEKTRVISNICMADDEYRKTFDAYRTAVNASYVSQRESRE